MEMVNKLIIGDVRQRVCINYKLHALLYQNFTTLCSIIDGLFVLSDKRKYLRKKLRDISGFLKYTYVSHRTDDSPDPYHGMKYSVKHTFQRMQRVNLLVVSESECTIYCTKWSLP